MLKQGVLVAVASTTATVAAATAAAAVTAATTAATATVAAASTAATTTVAAASATATTAAGAGSSGTSFIDGHIATGNRLTVEVFNRFFCTIGFRHFDKRKTTTAARFPIHDDVHSRHFAVLLKCSPKVIFGCRERQVPYINIRHKTNLTNRHQRDKMPLAFRAELLENTSKSNTPPRVWCSTSKQA